MARTTCMPRPPPPAVALISTGKPISRAIAAAWAPSRSGPSEPGTQGTPSFCMVSLAMILSPMRAMCSGVGPMKAMPWASTISANWAFSDKKPTPGWMASAPVIAAAETIAGMFK